MGSLNEDEIKEVQKHPVEGTKILKKMGYDSELLLNIVKHSHENFNGTGFPDGLKGEDIPLGSRIIAVVDTYAALTSWRPYREKWDRDVALDDIKQGADKGLYDPKIVETLVHLLS